MYVHKTPKILELLYPGLTWHKNRNEKNVFMTFDDGPVPNATDFVLHTLKTMEVKANFFCVGENIQKHQHTFKKLIESEHRIGNHTFNHLNGWKTDNETYYKNLLKCDQQINEKNPIKLFRPPYGKIKRSQGRFIAKTHQIIMWDVLSGDFDPFLEDDICLRKSINLTRGGSIIIFHDSNKTFRKLKYVLPRYIETILSGGYKFELL